MRTVDTINNEINELKKEMVSIKGTETEVYTRIVGYYRAVRNWNKGKRDEYNQRTLFEQPSKNIFKEYEANNTANTEIDFENNKVEKEDVLNKAVEPVRYIYFYRTTCPNCKPVKKWLGNLNLNGEAINVDEEYGFKKASEFQIYSSPTVIFTDNEGKEMYRATNTNALEEIFAEAIA